VSIQDDLNRVREWAQEKAQGGSEPPWAWYQYMKLVETVDAILRGMAATTTENSPQLVTRQGKLIQLTEAKCQRDTVQRHPGTAKIPLPM